MKQFVVRYKDGVIDSIVAERIDSIDGVLTLRTGNEIIFIGSMQHIAGVTAIANEPEKNELTEYVFSRDPKDAYRQIYQDGACKMNAQKAGG